jgi:hypothetical protein
MLPPSQSIDVNDSGGLPSLVFIAEVFTHFSGHNVLNTEHAFFFNESATSHPLFICQFGNANVQLASSYHPRKLLHVA